jgi:hypothetical protein
MPKQIHETYVNFFGDRSIMKDAWIAKLDLKRRCFCDHTQQRAYGDDNLSVLEWFLRFLRIKKEAAQQRHGALQWTDERASAVLPLSSRVNLKASN